MSRHTLSPMWFGLRRGGRLGGICALGYSLAVSCIGAWTMPTFATAPAVAMLMILILLWAGPIGLVGGAAAGLLCGMVIPAVRPPLTRTSASYVGAGVGSIVAAITVGLLWPLWARPVLRVEDGLTLILPLVIGLIGGGLRLAHDVHAYAHTAQP